MPRVKQTVRSKRRGRALATREAKPGRSVGDTPKYTIIKSTMDRSIKTEYNMEFLNDAVESCHCKLPRMKVDGTLEVYQHIFGVDKSSRALPLRAEGVYILTERDLITVQTLLVYKMECKKWSGVYKMESIKWSALNGVNEME